tara:strand:+ start:31766 stop:31933 length:168 start_codon:yes stop_codon:yes gene_type:complete
MDVFMNDSFFLSIAAAIFLSVICGTYLFMLTVVIINAAITGQNIKDATQELRDQF